MLIRKFKKNQIIQNFNRTTSTSTNKTKKINQNIKIKLNSEIDSYLNSPTIKNNNQNSILFNPNSKFNSIHQKTYSHDHENEVEKGNDHDENDPVSISLSELQSTSKPFSTAQAMNRAIHKVIQSLNSKNSPHQSYKIRSNWNQIYIQFLTSSSHPKQFANRIGELINKRLPKKSIDEIFKFHSSQTDLISVDSYNQLIYHSYKSENYHHARSLITEMEERGINKNQKTLELIACSYHAINKTKGVQLTLDSIKSNGNQVSNQCLTNLFSIRPRRSSKLQHFDNMSDLTTRQTSSHPSNTTNQEYQTWMSIEAFLEAHNWNPENLRNDGLAIVTITKRLMESGRWMEAYEFVNLILKLDLKLSKLDHSIPAISSYWSTTLLNTLVFGLYSLKRQTLKNHSKTENISIPQNSTTHFSSNEKKKMMNDVDNDKVNDYLKDLEINNIFEFVESFVDRNRSHKIKLNTKILLNCLRIQTNLSPTEMKRIIINWTNHYGLNPNLMGSRLGIRLLHVFSAWFISQIRLIKVHLHNLNLFSSSSSFDPLDLKKQIHSSMDQLIQEYLVINQDFLTCLEDTNTSTVEPGHETELKHLKLIERMILNGPVDGKFVQSNYRFISFQDLKSIHSSLKKIFKIHSKIHSILNLKDHSLESILSLDKVNTDSHPSLSRFVNPIPFKSSFYNLIHQIHNRIHPQSLDKSHFHPQNNLNHNHTIQNSNEQLEFQFVNNFFVCWSSENLQSYPIYLKTQS